MGNFLTDEVGCTLLHGVGWLVGLLSLRTIKCTIKHESALSQNMLAHKKPINEVNRKIHTTSIIPHTTTIQTIPNCQLKPMNSSPVKSVMNWQ